ncbi:MAG: hypothetical protein ACLVK4_16240 [Alistipes shahii]|uniref:hypothetical protein n=1 Tax=Alistipes shahii TaxID=328814 RepID=UPI00399CEAB6
MNQRVNFNISGGGKVARYYLAATFNQDNGLMRNEGMNNFNTNIDLKNTTSDQLQCQRHQNYRSSFQIPRQLRRLPWSDRSRQYPLRLRRARLSGRLPEDFRPDEGHRGMSHPLYGNTDGANHINPYALMSRGYKDYSRYHWYWHRWISIRT